MEKQEIMKELRSIDERFGRHHLDDIDGVVSVFTSEMLTLTTEHGRELHVENSWINVGHGEFTFLRNMRKESNGEWACYGFCPASFLTTESAELLLNDLKKKFNA